MKLPKNIIVGTDLAAKPSNPTGWAILEGPKVLAKHLFNDEELLAENIKYTPTLTAIDAKSTHRQVRIHKKSRQRKAQERHSKKPS